MSEVNKFVTQQFSLFENEESVQLPNLTESVTDSPYSSYVVYVDESGDHALQTIDPQYPVFVLAFCVFHKNITVKK